MGNDPTVEIVAKQRSELTDRIAKEVIRNFGSYNAAKYMKIAECEDPRVDGFRNLRLSPFTENMEEFKVYGNDRIPAEFLDVDFSKHPIVFGSMRYASIHTDVSAEDEFSISPKFPFRVVRFLLDPVMNDIEGIARVACGPPLELISLDRLQLTPEQQEQFRIVPYWQGPAKVGFNHFKYDQFRKLGIDGLTKAFLYANEHEE